MEAKTQTLSIAVGARYRMEREFIDEMLRWSDARLSWAQRTRALDSADAIGAALDREGRSCHCLNHVRQLLALAGEEHGEVVRGTANAANPNPWNDYPTRGEQIS